MLVNSCYVLRGMGVTRFQIAKVTFKAIQRHWQWWHSLGHIRFSISVPLQLCLYLAPLTRYWDLNLPRLYLAPRWGLIPLEFRRGFRQQKTKLSGLSYGVVCVMLGLAIFAELHLCRQTDRQTDGHTVSAYTALVSIASRGKNTTTVWDTNLEDVLRRNSIDVDCFAINWTKVWPWPLAPRN